LVSTEPWAASTAGEAKFSLAISCSLLALPVELREQPSATSGSVARSWSKSGPQKQGDDVRSRP
jgi:hypothetical protein